MDHFIPSQHFTLGMLFSIHDPWLFCKNGEDSGNSALGAIENWKGMRNALGIILNSKNSMI